ncbi:MAG: sigma-70 family RNA polymerase sigma factor [Bacteroidota bacterium]
MQKQLFLEYQELLMPIARNLLKDTHESEDMVQDTLLAWLSRDYSHIDNPKGYLVRTLINRCLNRLRSQKRTANVEIAPELLVDFLPSLVEDKDQISYTLLLMMERLTPMERAVFLLKEVFGYSHKEIAEILGISEAYARQILARAKRHIQVQKARFEVNTDQHNKLYESFVEVCKGRDLHQLIEILKEDVKLYIGGGSQSIKGCVQVAESLLYSLRLSDPLTSWRLNNIRGRTEIIIQPRHAPVGILLIEVDEGGSYANLYWENLEEAGLKSPEEIQLSPVFREHSLKK